MAGGRWALGVSGGGSLWPLLPGSSPDGFSPGRARRSPAWSSSGRRSGGCRRGRGPRRGPPPRAPALLPPATAAPLVYYLALPRLDDAWKLAGTANSAGAFGGRAWLAVIFGLGIFAVPAAFAYRRVARDFGARALRAGPPIALAVYVLPFGTFPYPALQGLTLPL